MDVYIGNVSLLRFCIATHPLKLFSQLPGISYSYLTECGKFFTIILYGLCAASIKRKYKFLCKIFYSPAFNLDRSMTPCYINKVNTMLYIEEEKNMIQQLSDAELETVTADEQRLFECQKNWTAKRIYNAYFRKGVPDSANEEFSG